MAIIFGSDGTLTCNYVKYNYKQARNIVLNGSGFNTSGWSMTGVTLSSYGYTSRFCFPTSSNTTLKLQQNCFQPTANHKYYGACHFKSYTPSYTVGDCRFEWWCNDTNLSGKLTFGTLDKNTTSWTSISSIQTAASSMASGSWYIRLFRVNATAGCYVRNILIVDLTDTFGSGNEPSQAWCDANILENYKLTVYNNSYGSQNITGYSQSNWKTFSAFNELTLNSNWEPREGMMRMISSTSKSEGLYTQQMSGSYLYKDYSYYTAMEVNDYYKEGSTAYTQDFPGNMRYQFYYPVSEPSMGYHKAIRNRLFNGGGGMQDWRRISAYNSRSSFSDQTGKPFRFDLDNEYYQRSIRCTTPMCVCSNRILHAYINNIYSYTAMEYNDINKEFCDRWVQGRNSAIIHIKDPNNTQIKFLKPMQEMKRSSTSSYTKANVDSLVGMSDSWGSITNASSLKVGDYAYLSFTESTNNKASRFIVKVNSVSGTTVSTDNLGWGYVDTSTADNARALSAWYEFADGYGIQCNDIEIRPELSSITFDSTGTIKCRKLITNF